MISTAVPNSGNRSAAIILLAAVAVPPVGFSQSRLAVDAERQQQIIERVQQEESRSGPYSDALIGPLSDLALIYQERGDHDLAVAVIHRVRQVVRANEGLHSLEQIPLIQQMIANEEAIGRLETAWELEQDLLTLAKRHPGDIRTVPVFRETAGKRMTLLRQYLAGDFPPQMVFGCYYGWPRRGNGYTTSRDETEENCNAGMRDDAIRAIVSDAQTNYAQAIAVMQRNELYSSDELRELELGLLRSIELIRQRTTNAYDLMQVRLGLEPWRSWAEAMERIAPQLVAEAGRDHESQNRGPTYLNRYYYRVDYRLGRQSLERSLAYEIATSAPLPNRVEAFVRLADWDMSDSRNSRALDQYQRAYDTLREAGAHTSIDELFSPKVPVVLPTSVSNPLASNAAHSTGYVDVAFEVSRHGEGQRIEILDTTTNATDADKTRLVHLIKSSRFRPRVTDGKFARASSVVLRYYLTE